ncbi:DUF2157 domain-containing protein [Candidatus Woesearchaeota archaeon]|nr:DUF2157 domain-containing protein [Candidatus Woesearchaeota archaeon]
MLNKKGASFGTIIAVFGSILIALGIGWLIAQNWHQIPAALKIIILLSSTSGAYVAGSMLRIRGYANIGKSLLVLGALLYTWSIFLIAQIFFTESSLQGTTNLMLIAWLGVLAASYALNSSASLVVALVEFVIWLSLQFFAFYDDNYYRDPSFGLLTIIYLAVGVLLYGMSLLHRARQHKFGSVYQWWTGFYLLLFAYILSFQIVLPHLWSGRVGFSAPLILVIVVTALALIVMQSGLIFAKRSGNLNKRELIGVSLFTIFLMLVIISTIYSIGKEGYCNSRNYNEGADCNRFNDYRESCLNEKNCYWSPEDYNGIFGGNKNPPISLWLVWIFSNLVFLGIILVIIGYGTWQKQPRIINLGIFFFALDILSRYIGFIMDFWGYTSLAITFIIGGVILIIGGFYTEKWRRKLVAQARSETGEIGEVKKEEVSQQNAVGPKDQVIKAQRQQIQQLQKQVQTLKSLIQQQKTKKK